MAVGVLHDAAGYKYKSNRVRILSAALVAHTNCPEYTAHATNKTEKQTTSKK